MKAHPSRLDIAKHALQGLLAKHGRYWQCRPTGNPDPSENLGGLLPNEAALSALQYADALLAAADPPAELGLGLTPAGKKPKPAVDTDEQWLESLKTREAYIGINIPVEFSKMQAWCEVNRKTASRKRFLNWLNRAEKPLAGAQASQDGPNEVGPPPCPDWKRRAERLRNREFRLSWATHARTDVNLASDIARDMEENP